MARVHVESLGCRANQADGLALAARFSARGHEPAAVDEADLVVVNTCTVTAQADRDARRLVQQIRRRAPGARLVVTGCLAERDPETVRAWPGVDAVVPGRAKATLPMAVLGAAGDDSDAADGTLWDTPKGYPGLRALGQTRAFFKVQDGCDARCSYCVIPVTRGPSRSLAPERVVAAVAALGREGVREVVLTGIHLGHYGRDRGASLGALLDALAGRERPERIRLTSIEPNEVDGELVARFAANPRLAPHFHLPLQSGSDRVLARMRRPYTARAYAAAVARVARAFDEPAIGADLIAGFPGESADDFAETVALVRALPLTYVHVFRYSARPGTAALRLDGQVAPALVAERAARLRALGQDLAAGFARRRLGATERALTLEGRQGGATPALTDRFLEVWVEGERPANEWLRARLTGADPGRLAAAVVGGD